MSNEWSQEAVALNLATLCKGSGLTAFNPEAVKKVWLYLANKERNRPEPQRIGFWYTSEYAETGKTKFLNQVRAVWNSTPKPLMSDLIVANPPGTVHKYLCVLSIKLDRDNYDPKGLHATLKDYLIQAVASPFDVLVSRCCHTFGQWYDLEIKYSTDITAAFKALSAVPWIHGVYSRPISKFGQYSPELI